MVAGGYKCIYIEVVFTPFCAVMYFCCSSRASFNLYFALGIFKQKNAAEFGVYREFNFSLFRHRLDLLGGLALLDLTFGRTEFIPRLSEFKLISAETSLVSWFFES